MTWWQWVLLWPVAAAVLGLLIGAGIRIVDQRTTPSRALHVVPDLPEETP